MFILIKDRYKNINNGENDGESGKGALDIGTGTPESTITSWKMKRTPRMRQTDELEEFSSSTTIDTENP